MQQSPIQRQAKISIDSQALLSVKKETRMDRESLFASTATHRSRDWLAIPGFRPKDTAG